MTIHEVADLLRCSTRTVHRLIDRGEVDAKAKEISEATGGFVRVTVRQMNDRSEFHEELKALARGSGIRGPVLQQISAGATPVELSRFLVDRDSEGLANKTGLGTDQARRFMEHAWSRCVGDDGAEQPSKLYEIGLVELKDAVIVELRVDGRTYKPMQELSGGSKCTAILSVALVEGTCPLVVDQPEDALDNPFVFEEIVKRVRRTKSERQYIFTTHNPNVAVASDADLIYCLKANATEGEIDAQGSVDEITTRDKVVANLEGGDSAFRLRSQKYSIVIDDPNAVVLDPQTL